MNRVYRLVFNRTLGVMQVASELVTSPRGGIDARGGHSMATLRPISFALWLMLGWVGVAQPLSAQQGPQAGAGHIVADPGAPAQQRPTVVTSANGTPQVNITTPSAAGVSRNQYQQFDVGPQGVILNNSRGDVQTQIGGWVQGNPWLATGTARVILNEVNASNPSQLNGYVEVAGTRAQVVIANPAGIQVDGAGFLNASRVTLTTGAPIVNNGALEGYRVEGGAIRIAGAGLDASRTDYTDIISRSLEVNAGVWAQQLQATLGSNVVSADHTAVQKQQPGTAAPAFALDVGALGGMYANRIWLVGNEHGLGMRNAGRIGAQAGELVITADGLLQNKGAVHAQQDTRINATGGIANAGTLSAERELRVDTDAGLDNSGGTLNARRLEINAASLRNQGGAIEQVGAQALQLQARDLGNVQGRIGAVAAGGSTPGGGTGGGDGGSTGGGDTGGTPGTGGAPGNGSGGTPTAPTAPLATGVLNIAGALDNGGGSIDATGVMQLDARNSLDNSGGTLGVDTLQVQGEALRNVGGTLQVQGAASAQVQQLDNSGGRMTLTQTFGLQAQSLLNRGGSIAHGGTAATQWWVGTLDNSGGSIASNASSLGLLGASLINAGGSISHAGSAGLQIQAGQLLGSKGAIATSGDIVLQLGHADHRQAQLIANQITLDAAAFDNRGGSVVATGQQANLLRVEDHLDNSEGGTLASNGDLLIRTALLGNAQGTVQQAGAGTLRIEAADLQGQGGTLLSNGSLLLQGDSTQLAGGTTAAQRIDIDTGDLVTAGGTLTSASTDVLRLQVARTLDNSGGSIGSNGALSLDTGTLVNNGGKLIAAGSDGSAVRAGTQLQNQQGVLSGNGDLVIETAALDNRSGAIDHAGTGVLQISAGTVDGAKGSIASNGALHLHAQTLALQDAATRAQQVDIRADQLDNSGGSLLSLSAQAMQLRVSGLLRNDQGSITANGAQQISAGTLSNRGGALNAAGTGNSAVQVSGSFDNSGGTLASNAAALQVQAGALLNRDGTISHAGDAGLRIETGTLDGQKGRISTAGLLQLRADEVDHRQATLAAAQLQLQAQAVDNRSGSIVATGTGPSTLTVDHALNNGEGGVLASNGDLSVRARTLDNTGGTVQQAGSGTLAIEVTTLAGQDGTLLSNGALLLEGQDIDLGGGTTSARQIRIDSERLSTAGGALSAVGEGSLQLIARSHLDNTGGSIAGNGAVDIAAGRIFNDHGKLIAAGEQASRIRAQQLDNRSGTISGNGDLRIDTSTLNGEGGTLAASEALLLTADNVDLRDGATGAHQITVAAGSLDNRGGVLSATGAQALQLHVREALRNDGGTLAANGAQHIQAGAFSNRDGTVSAAGTAASHIRVDGALDNSEGLIASNAATLEISSGSLRNVAGTLNHAGTQGLSLTTGALDGRDGVIVTAGALTLQAGEVDHRGGTVQAVQLAVDAAGVDNRGGQLVATGSGANRITVAQALDNGDDGLIASNGDLQISAERLGNAAGSVQQAGTGALVIAAQTLAGAAGTLISNGSLTLTGETTDLRDAATSAHKIDITTGTLTTAGGTLAATGTDTLTLKVRGALDNTRGTVASNGALALQAGAVRNDAGTLQAAGAGGSQLQVQQALSNRDGRILTSGALAVDAASINNQGGTLHGAADLEVSVDGLLDNSTEGLLASGGALQLQAKTLDNRSGGIEQAGAGELRIEVDTLDGAKGRIISNGALALQGEALDLSGGTTAAKQITVAAGSLQNAGGTLSATGEQAMRLDVRDALGNDGGTIAANGSQQINAGSLSNVAGTLSSAGSADSRIAIAGRLDNTRGTVVSNGTDLHLQTGTLVNQAGRINHAGQGTLVLDSGDLHGRDGVIASAGALTLRADQVDHRGATLSADQLEIEVDDLDNRGGTVLATGTDATVITVTNTLDNSDDGTLASNGDLQLRAATLNNIDGTVQQAGTGRLAIDATTLNGKGGTLVSNGALELRGALADLRDATTSAQRISIHADALTTAGGQLVASGNDVLDLQVQGRLDNTGGTVATNGTVNLSAHALINNQGTLQAAGNGNNLLQVTQALENRDGRLLVSGNTRIDAGHLVNQAGTLQAGGTLTLDVEGVLDNSAQGAIASGGDAQITATVLDNQSGSIEHAGEGTLAIAVNELDGAKGRIVGNGALTLQGDRLDLSGGTTGARAVNVRARSLDNSAGMLSATGTGPMVLQVQGTLRNDGGTIAANGAQQITAGTLSNIDGTLSSAGTGVTRIEVDGRFDNTDGVVASNGSSLHINARELVNQDGTLSHGGDELLALQVDTLDGAGGTIASAGQLTLEAGSVDHRGATLNAEQFTVTAASFNNQGGTVLATGGQPSSLQVTGVLDNGAGGTLASNADLTVRADVLGNAGGTVQQAGTGTLDITARMLDGQGGKLLSNGSLQLSGEQTDLRDATTAAREVRIETGNLTTAGGMLSASGTGVLSLQVREVLDNTAGTLAGNGTLDVRAAQLINNQGTVQAAGTGSNLLQAAAALENRGGRILTTGDATLKAGSLDNRGGVVHADGSATLTVDVDGLLDNSAQGTLSSGGAADISAQGLNNESGTLAAGSALQLDTQGQLRNAAGLIQAGGLLQLSSAGVDNQAGRIIAGMLALDTRAATLDNRAGTIASLVGAADLRTGQLDNSGGLLQSAGNLRIDTAGQALRNTYSNGNGINSAGTLDIITGALDNRGGSVFGQGNITLQAATVDNGAGGSLSGASNLLLRAQQVGNVGGAIAVGGNADIVLPGSLDNRGGLVAAGGTLVVQADSIDNRDTRTAAGGPARGLQGQHVQLGSNQLYNQNGQVLGDTVNLQINGHLDNSGGQVSASNTSDVRADSIANAGGVLVAGTHQIVRTREITGGGQLLSQGDLTLELGQSHTNTGELAANGTLTLAIQGNLDNLGKLQGGGVNISAGNINNAAGAEISSVGLTRVVAAGELNNRGLLDGQVTHVDAGTLNNIGTGRIYGDHVAINAGAVNNVAETVGGVQRSATIAARQRLDLGAGTLTNSGRSLIFSDGDARIGGALSGLTAVGNAQRIDNLGSTIEIAGNLDMAALAVNNLRVNYDLRENVVTVHAPVTMNQPAWFQNQNNTEALRTTSNYQPYEIYYLDPSAIIEDGDYITPDGQKIRRAVVKLTANTSAYYFGHGGLHGARGERARLNVAEGTFTIYYVGRADNRNNPDQLGAASEDPFRDLTRLAPGAPAFRYETDNLTYNSAYGTCTTNCVQLITYLDYHDPDTTLTHMHRDANNTADNEKYRIARRTTVEDVLVSAGDNAVINSGGNMRITTDALTNHLASIGSGGNLDIVGLNVATATLTNTARTLVRKDTYSSAAYSYRGRYIDTTTREIVQEVGVIGSGINAAGRLTIDVGELRNENVGAGSPNVSGGALAGNINTNGPGAGSVGPGAGAVQGPGQTSGQGADAVNAQGPGSVGAAQGPQGQAVQGPGSLAGQAATAAQMQAPEAAGAAQGGSGSGVQVPGQTSGQQAGAVQTQGPVQAGAAGQGPSPAQAVNAGQAGQATANGPATVQAGSAAGSDGNAVLGRQQAVAASGDDPRLVVTTAPNTAPPSASLFNVDANRGSYLVETDPRFASYRDWLSSDYLLQRAGYEPSQTQKRLGDGFYEQKLVREQIGQLTGRRFLTGHASDEDQYRALLEAGATVASEWGLTPGVALSAEQMARLTSDIVWLVEQDVTLADGSVTRALVPQVYLRVMPGDLDTNGALLSGADVDISVRGNLVNSGSIAGRQLVSIDAGNIRNLAGAQISGQQVGLQARQDIEIIGSTITATDAIGLKAGGNITVASTTHESSNGGQRVVQQTTTLDRVAGLYVTNKNGAGVLSVNAGGDVELRAAQLSNAGAEGLTAIVAGGNLNLSAIAEKSTTAVDYASGGTLRQSQLTHVGTTIGGAGDVVLKAGGDINLAAATVSAANALVAQAGRDINSIAVVDTSSYDSSTRTRNNARAVSASEGWVLGNQFSGGEGVALQAGRDLTLQASTVDSSAGGVLLSAGRDVALTTAQQTHNLMVDESTRKKSTLSSTRTTTHDESAASYAVGTIVGGRTVDIIAANNVGISGSTVLAEKDLRIAAANNITIESAQDTYSEASSFSQKKSGITGGFANGVASVGYSTSRSNSQNASQSTTQVASAVGSLEGSVLINAGNQLTIAASDVAAGQNLTLAGKDINLIARQDTQDAQSSASSRSSGFSVGVTYDPTKAYRSARDNTTGGMADSGSTMGAITRTAEGMASGLRAATTSTVITAGSQRANSSQSSATSDARVAQLSAGGDLTLVANGGSIYSQGAQMAAEGDALLLATKDIVFDVAHNTQSSDSSSRAKGWGMANNTSGLPFGTNNARSEGSGSSDTITGTQLSVGGGVRMATSEGDIALTAANIVAEKDVNIHAAGDLTIRSGQDTVSNTNTSRSKAIGTVQISDTEKFSGWHRQEHDDDSAQVSQVASNVGSLGGNVNLSAGGTYSQIASNVVAANDINITAAQIQLLTADEVGHSSQRDDDLKIGVFARVKSPFIDLINNVDAARQSDGRLQQMQGMAAAANAYQSASAVANAMGAGGSGALFSAEAGIGFKTADSRADSRSVVSQGSTLQAGGNLNLTSTKGDIHVVQGNLSAGNTLSLDSAGDILLEAGRAELADRSRSSNAGAEVGVGVSVGAQTGVYVYAEASVGSSRSNAESTTWQNTTLSGQNISLRAEGDTTLRGATATADRIDVKTGGTLTIESLQDVAESMASNSQVGGRVQVSFGTAWNADGYASAGKSNGSYQGVGQQSGLFAGDGGYHVDAGHVNLVGGAIASTKASNSELSAQTLSFSDLQNQMQHSTSSGSISGGYGGGASNWAPTTEGATPNFGGGVPMNQKGGDSSTTYATLTEGNIVIGGKQVSAAELGLNTDAAAAHRALDAMPNAEQQLANQQAMANAMGTVMATSKQIAGDIGNQAMRDLENGYLAKLSEGERERFMAMDAQDRDLELRAQLPNGYRFAVEQQENWGIGSNNGRALEAVTTLLVGVVAGQGGTQVAANTLAPYAANLIGDKFDTRHGSDPNVAAQLLSHALLGALLAEINGGNAAGGAAAAAGGELAAQMLTQALYPDHEGELSATQKQTILALSQVVGAIAAGVGKGVADAALGSDIGGNAVENNWLSKQEVAAADEAMKACDAKGDAAAACRKQIVDAMNELDRTRDRALFDGERRINQERLEKLRDISALCGMDAACHQLENAFLDNWYRDQRAVLAADLRNVPRDQLVVGGYYPDGKAAAFLDGFMERAKGTPDRAVAAYDYLAERKLGIFGDLYDGTVNAIKGAGEWFTRDIPAQAIEQKIDYLATSGVENLGGMTFDGALGTLTGYLGGQAVQLVAGKWLPLTGKALDDFIDRTATDSLLRSGGLHRPDGTPILDLRSLSTDQKRIVGEMFGERGVKAIIPEGQKLARVQGAGTNGIDDLYRVSRPDVDYVIIEYKYGSSKLGDTLDGRQMSDSWLTGQRTGFDRIQDAVGDPRAAADIQRALASNRVERWVVHTDPQGGVSVGLLNASGRFIPRPDMASKILGK